MLITGAIFKATVPDESDLERRELERSDSHCHKCGLRLADKAIFCRMVAEAAQPKAKQTSHRHAKAKREEMVKQAKEADDKETKDKAPTPPLEKEAAAASAPAH